LLFNNNTLLFKLFRPPALNNQEQGTSSSCWRIVVSPNPFVLTVAFFDRIFSNVTIGFRSFVLWLFLPNWLAEAARPHGEV
jgi:hypothetical protein